jgi:hypothetical protein
MKLKRIKVTSIGLYPEQLDLQFANYNTCMKKVLLLYKFHCYTRGRIFCSGHLRLPEPIIFFKIKSRMDYLETNQLNVTKHISWRFFTSQTE